MTQTSEAAPVEPILVDPVLAEPVQVQAAAWTKSTESTRLLAMLLALAGPAPLVVIYFWQLGGFHPHYQFAPWYLLSLLWIGWNRAGSIQLAVPQLHRGLVTFIAGVGTVCLGTYIWSPWLGFVGWMLLLPAVLRPWREWRPIWSFAWLAVPPPLNLDVQFLRLLKQLAAQTTGNILDWLEIPNVRQGVTFETVGRKFFVEDACGGIDSLFALLSTAAFWILITRSRRPIAFLTLLSTGLIAFIVNVFRLSAIIVAHVNLQLDWASGDAHEVLGYVCFGAGLLLVLSAYEWWHFWLSTKPQVDLTPLNYFEDEHRAVLPVVPPLPVHDSPPKAWANVVSQSLLIGFGLVSLLWQLETVTVRSWRHVTNPASHSPPQLIENAANLFTEDDLPPWIGPWERIGFVASDRGQRISGEFSKTWIYQTEFGKVEISCDFPFQSMHSLWICYQSLGWMANDQGTVYSSDTTHEPIRFFTIRRGDFDQGYVLFRFVGSAGENQTPDTSWSIENADSNWGQRLIGRLDVPNLVGASRASSNVFQLQAFASTQRLLTDHEKATIRTAFETSSALIRQKLATSPHSPATKP